MSASREKKQRQAAGPSERALYTQQQQAARKQKTIIYAVVAAVIVALVAALLIWRSWKFGFIRDQITASQAKNTAATVGDENLSVAELSYYYYNARMNEFSYYSYLGLTPPSDSDVMDSETGQTYRDYFLETALNDAQESIVLADEAKKDGHTEAEVKDSLNTQIERFKAQAASYNYSYSSYLKAMYGAYMSSSVFEKLYTRDLLGSLAGNDKYNELLDSYSEADLRAYYEADDHADSLDTFEYSYLYFTPDAVEEKDKDGNDLDEDTVAELKKAALAEAKADAEEALKAVKAGGSISDQAGKYELADTRYGDHVSAVGISRVISAVQDELLSMKAGDVKLVENGESGYYVVTLHSRKLVEDPTKDVRHILARAENTTNEDGYLVAPTDEAWAAAKEKIEAIKAEYEAGAKTEDSFAALANEKSDDGDGTTGGLYTKIGPNDNYVPEFLEWIYNDGRKIGDTGIVQHDAGETVTSGYWGYHFMYLAGDNEPVWMRDTRKTMAEEETNAWVEELKGNYEAALTDGAKNVGQ